ncbi:acyltransferase domain-containing protein [Streptomyces sp. NPDC058989]|uniref:acyltransferase domain-containing protein n=1 Tax=Streptomyces sp. NPDC058989 TaxID=3346686 RepID=UPI00368066DC
MVLFNPTEERRALARRVVSRNQPWRGRNDLWFTSDPLLGAPHRGKVAFLFPGLESTFAPQMDDVIECLTPCGQFRNILDSTAPVDAIGRHSLQVIYVGKLLNAALNRMGIHADAVAGHSIGEWTAMMAAGAFSDAGADALLNSFNPDEICVPPVSFGAVGASADAVGKMLASHLGVVLSHDNGPRQSVVCGPLPAVQRLLEQLRDHGISGQVLPFRSGFHTPMLAPYLSSFREATSIIPMLPPRIPLWSGTLADPFPATAPEMHQLFIRHLLEPVRFRPLVKRLHETGVRVFMQVGTGQLSALVGQILRGHPHLAIAANSPRRSGLQQLLRVAAAMWVEGRTVDPRCLQ